MIGGGAGGSAPSVDGTFLVVDNDETNATVYTHSGLTLGAAATDRKIVCCTTGQGHTGSLRTVNSLTIGGVSASQVVTITSSANWYRTDIWQADVPSGTTGDVVVTYNATMREACVALYRLTGAGTGPTAASDTETDDSVSTDALSVSIDCPAGGFLVAVCGEESSGSPSWAGITQDYDQGMDAGDRDMTGASDSFVTVQTGLTVSVTSSGSSNMRMSAASWGPA